MLIHTQQAFPLTRLLRSRAQCVPSSFPLVKVKVNNAVSELGWRASDKIHELIAVLCRLVQPVVFGLVVYNLVCKSTFGWMLSSLWVGREILPSVLDSSVHLSSKFLLENHLYFLLQAGLH